MRGINLSQQKYLPQIDGLRALCVLSVFVFHINSSILPGGFLGVDIFFVLSGFLIGEILIRENSIGNFSFLSFFTRRMRRILPAFFAVLLTTTIIVAIFFMPEDKFTIVKSGLFAIFFAANFFFARQGGYFDTNANEKPLLHTWSLSIEEQFYAIFPVILFSLYRFRIRILPVLIALFLVFFVMTCIDFSPLTRAKILNTYYLPHVRGMEILLGVFLAMTVMSGAKIPEKFRNFLSIFAILGLIFCLATFGFIHENPRPPVFLTLLLPCIFAVILIFSTLQPCKISRFLSARPLVYIGKISFSLYLWHWVVLVCVRYFMGELNIFLTIFVIFCAFFLTILTYHAIENPIRHAKFFTPDPKNSQKLAFLRAFFLLFLLPSVTFGFLYQHIRNERKILRWKVLPCYKNPDVNCNLGDLTKKRTVLAIGDSHTGVLSSFIDILGRHEGFQAQLTTVGSCPFLLDFFHAHATNEKDIAECTKRRELYLEKYKNFDTIVLSNYWAGGYGDTEDTPLSRALGPAIREMRANGKRVIVVNTAAHMDVHKMRQNTLPFMPKNQDLMFSHSAPQIAKIKKISEENGASFVNLFTLLPKSYIVDGFLLFNDGNHLSAFAMELVAKKFIENGEIFVQNPPKQR